jgi:hypothetical protein
VFRVTKRVTHAQVKTIKAKPKKTFRNMSISSPQQKMQL